MVVLDITMFFLIGRMPKRKGFDRLVPCIIPMLIGMIYPSWSEANLWFLRHSFSTYEIICTWPWQLYIYCIVVATLSFMLVKIHVRGQLRDGKLVSNLVEILLSILVFIVPIMSHPNFHLHHYYVARIIGMHLNSSDRMSQAAQAFFWGQFVNGIAAWGRDPVLTCAYAYYVSTDINCSYMSCYLDTSNATNNNSTSYKPFVQPDWHNCSASYVP